MKDKASMNEPVIQPKRTRKKFDNAFKQRAVELWLSSGRTATAVAAERSAEQLETENAGLRRENDYLRQQRDILKKTLGILSETPTSAFNGSTR